MKSLRRPSATSLASDFDGGGITGWMDYSPVMNVTAALRSRGFSDSHIGKLWSGNPWRVWQGVEDRAHAE